MKVLIIGSGGREHALAWKLHNSPLTDEIFVAPGNAGTAVLAENLSIAVTDSEALLAFATETQIDLTIVGPEVPLAAGIVDLFQAASLPIFGPTQAAAQLEASKAFAKQFMTTHNIPTAAYASFTNVKKALAYLQNPPFPIKTGVVIKASGLAAGKGVIICDTLTEAEKAVQEIMIGRSFGQAGNELIIEERLAGPEVSLLAFCDGKTAVPMLPARDHKRALNNDQGLNTGGMGAFTPVPNVDGALIEQMMQTVIQPTVDGMAANGTPYVGVLYAGIMLTPNGLRVLEFNCRFGDPETQVLLPMLNSDLVEIMLACINGELDPSHVRRRPGACVTVVIAAPGYPGGYPKGLPITGLETISNRDDVMAFQAGTKQSGDRIVTNGGRVMAVTAWGKDMETAVSYAYQNVEQLFFEGAHYRTDIGKTSKN